MNVLLLEPKTDKTLFSFKDLSSSVCISDIKKKYHAIDVKLYPDRQSLRLEPKGKSLPDNKLIGELTDPRTPNTARLYLRDLGPQVAWTTVFLSEYAGPLFVYLFFYIIRTNYEFLNNYLEPMSDNLRIRKVALLCWIGHYVKRLAETIWIHRFSHATMPISNLFKNCTYYWGFAAFVGYFTNHPLYTPPSFGNAQFFLGLGLFLLGESGNFACHLALRWLRPKGSTERRVPQPVPGLPFTGLFHLVACPNYTYEIVSWLGFTVMTQTLPAALFTLAGAVQMSIWALGKLRNYRKDFPNEFPRHRRAILPYIL